MTASGRFVGKFWSVILALVAFNRAMSYLERPPTVGAAPVIEGVVPYALWGVLLIVGATLLLVGVCLDVKVIKLGAHVGLAVCFAIFSASIVVSAFVSGTGWSGSGTAAVTVLLHLERVSTLLHTMFGGREGE